MNADETREWIKAHNSKNYPYCGLCYTEISIGKWSHCAKCESERIKHENN